MPQPENSVQDPHEIEMERKKALLARVRVMREKTQLNRGAINLDMADPNKVYHWINKDQSRIIEFTGLGYQIVRTEPVKKGARGLSDWQAADGTHVRGDLILMCVDREIYEALSTIAAAEGYERLQGVREAFNSMVERTGAKPEAA